MIKLSKTIISLLIFTASFIPLSPVKAASQTPITRSEAENRALTMINLNWTYSSDKNGNIPENYSSAISQPTQFKDSSTLQCTGIPYDWGGQDSLDSNSFNAPWNNFLTAVNNGAFTGNVNTDGGLGYIPGTCGIDCSGFVQATFNIKDYKLSTSTMFNTYFTKIDLKDIKHMDILNRSYDHVVIFDKLGTLNGVYGAFTYESTPDQIYGGIQGTKKYFLSMDEINNGYEAGRYINIVEDTQNTLPHPLDAGVFAKVSNVNYSANLRTNPSTTSTIISTIPKDSILYLSDYSQGFYKVTFNGQTGWIYGSLISELPKGKYVTIKNCYSLNIRSNPSSSSSIVGYLTENNYAEVIDYSADGKWFKIRINGIEGYSSGNYLSYIY